MPHRFKADESYQVMGAGMAWNRVPIHIPACPSNLKGRKEEKGRPSNEAGLGWVSEAPDPLHPSLLPALLQVGAVNMTPVQCYLDSKSIVKVAKKQGVDVIHPGYGEREGK
jgi:pyruvate carboxylase